MTAVPFTKIIKGMTAGLANRKENGCLDHRKRDIMRLLVPLKI
jgi:hypothetical protein